jgi:hypothetical protein
MKDEEGWRLANNKERLILLLEDAEPRTAGSRVPFHVRTRRALKCLLRSFGLRCRAFLPDAATGKALPEEADETADPPGNA